ncbi:unnamed protein product [Hydatigera taeniaeformis]|uniref:Uncharacterized protein n=1 Tax=Hydatigena taeniaeformis TaxID=6205 RepID=A0A0R3X1N0_HYDTA|nr:unnamed protein product [Hydatigera taeniaeformis]
MRDQLGVCVALENEKKGTDLGLSEGSSSQHPRTPVFRLPVCPFNPTHLCLIDLVLLLLLLLLLLTTLIRPTHPCACFTQWQESVRLVDKLCDDGRVNLEATFLNCSTPRLSPIASPSHMTHGGGSKTLHSGTNVVDTKGRGGVRIVRRQKEGRGKEEEEEEEEEEEAKWVWVDGDHQLMFVVGA